MILNLLFFLPLIYLINLLALRILKFPDRFYDTLNGPQKFHNTKTLRIGGVFFIFNLFIIYLLIYFLNIDLNYIENLIVFCTVLVAIICLSEDIKFNLQPISRLLILIITVSLIVYLTDLKLIYLDIFFIDNYIKNSNSLAYFLSVFAIIAIINGNNLIDGFNGLMLSFSILFLIILSLIFYIQLGHVSYINILFIFSLLPVFFLNFPKGKIFMGDAGSFSIGFYLAIISIYYSNVFPNLSPWLFLNLVSYQFIEILFSILRKKFIEKSSPLKPDKFHLHMLLYNYLNNNFKFKNSNYLTSTIIFFIFSPFYISIFFINHSLTLLILNFLSIFVIYITIYLFLRFKITYLQ